MVCRGGVVGGRWGGEEEEEEGGGVQGRGRRVERGRGRRGTAEDE